MFEFTGTFAPIATPFTDDGNQLSEVRLARMIQRLVGRGVQGIAVNTDLGEFTSTSFGERKSVLEFVIRDTRNAVPVFAHVTTLNTAASLDLAQHAERHGARGILIMPPYYGDLTDTELTQHFRTIARYCGLPIIVIDPQQRMSEAVRYALADAGNFSYADPMVRWPNCEKTIRTMEWSLAEVDCSPLCTLWGDLTEGDPALLAQWASLMKDLGSLRVIKAAYAAGDAGIGEPRSPYGGLTAEQLAVVNILWQMGQKEKTADTESAA